MGKTRLAQEAAARAGGLRVVWAACPPRAAALRPWATVVRALAGAGTSPYLDALLAGGEIPAGDPETVRWRLPLDLADVLEAASARTPLLIVLDDLHDADASSLRLLADLEPALHRMPVAVLATAREDETAWRGRADVWAALLQSGAWTALEPFTAGDVAALAAAAGPDPEPGTVRTIMRRTGGNPLLVTELIRHGAAGGAGALGDAVPASVRAIVTARAARLTGRTRAVLAAAAVLGADPPRGALARLAGLPPDELRAALAEAAAAGLLDGGRFRHTLIRDAVHDCLPAGEREALHAEAARSLGEDADAAEIAHHLALAGPAHAGAAADRAVTAGDHAAARLAFEDAARWYERAAGGTAGVRRAEVLLRLGDARLSAGDRDGARAAVDRAAGLARAADRPDLLARAALVLGAGPLGFEVGMLDRAQLDLLAEARAALPATRPDLSALVTARLSVASSLLEPDPRRLALATEAVRLARASGDATALAAALAALCDAQAGPDHCADRRAHATEIIELASGLRNAPLELLGRRLRFVAHLETGAMADAQADALAFGAAAAALRHPRYLWLVPLWRGMWALREGRYDECRLALGEAETIGARAGSANASLLVQTQRWCLLAALGDRDGLAGMLAALDSLEPDGVWPRISRALLLAQLGRTGEARAGLDAVAPLLPGMPRDSEWLPALAQVAETVALAGPHPVASWVRDRLAPYRDLYAVEGFGAAVRGPVAHFLDLLDDRSGGPPGGPGGGSVFRREGEFWTVRYRGVETRLRDGKGLRDLARLLAEPGREIAALDLATATSPDRASEPDPGTGGLHEPSDTGEVLDATARAAYRERLRELEGDPDRAAEREALLEALASAYGLGGRVRRTGSAAERARTAVTSRIRGAVRRIARDDPALGRHLDRSVRTGAFCVYDPDPPEKWTV